MKKLLYTFLYLNIYSIFSLTITAQEIELKVEAENIKAKETIDSLLSNKKFPNYNTLKKQSDSLANQLEKIGYIESRLIDIKKLNDSIFISEFYLGDRIKNIKIFYSKESFTESELINISSKIKDSYFIIPFEDVESTLKKLTSYKTENGDAFASINLSEVKKENASTLSAQLSLTSNQKRTIDDYVIKGYEKFPTSYLKYFSGLKKNTVFSQTTILKKNEILNSLGFVSTIKPPETLFKKDSTIVYFYLKKENNNLFDGILGFNTNEETNKLQLNGYLNLELNNNLNYGEQLLINYKADGQEQVNFKTKATLPYIFKSPVGIELQLQIFKRDSSFVTTDQQARLSYQISPAIKSYIGYKSYESSNLLDNAVAGVAVQDYNSSFAIGGIQYLKSQSNPFFPIKTSIKVDTELGSREANDGLREKQTRILFNGLHIFNLNKTNSIFLKNVTSALFSDTFFENELYRFGGITSIRGFNENSIDASLFTVINTEYRIFLNNSIYAHSILDLAYFENKQLDLEQNLYSVGFGFGLNTNAGVLKLAFANGLIESRNFEFSNSKIHIILTTRF
ncbi:hypothetical protein [Patiriisocius hiemis]|uniref:POTRA domain-containing protein n=1 Tax=Patiriisocius hiemis TaxID=3075604 RepID=A0ABU2YFC5_9FLAO|nr:hypothetical protein [Constantimarinum sp. W242]MDT0556881.1 hypothetical protein [Constantimarinum sp. W242]